MNAGSMGDTLEIVSSVTPPGPERVTHLASEDVGHASGGASERSPLEIPDEFMPDWVDYHAIADDLEDDGVAAPPEYVDGLREVVDSAAGNGLDLKIVITDSAPPVYTAARDLATTLAEEYDGTIFVHTPQYRGAFSDTISRAQLEAGQDDSYREQDPVLSAVVFEGQISEPAPPWGVYSAVILTTVVVGVALFLLLLRRRATKR